LTVLLSFVDNGSDFGDSSIMFCFVYKQRERGEERRGPQKHKRQIILPFIPGFLEHLAECQFKERNTDSL
jgi:hypothetical protein